MDKLKTKKVKLVSLQDWNNLVREVYGKPYSFQQQDDCMPRGTIYRLEVPNEEYQDFDIFCLLNMSYIFKIK